ncbi:MAG: NAD(+) diphosphatase [Desulfobacterales bacterium]
MSFKPEFNPEQPKTDHDLWFVISDGKIVVQKDREGFRVPEFIDVKHLSEKMSRIQYFGIQDDCPCHIAEIESSGITQENGFELKGLFELIGWMKEDVILTAACAAQLIRWFKTHTYCGQCGRPMEDKTDERAKRCPDCNLVFYPRLSPAVIMAVVHHDKLLLARSGRFPTGFYSVLAGFVEPGETLEECVVREVFEEVGIWVKNVRYFGSQPWPFPDSLMLGFTAEYSHGDLNPDPSEIADAGWFAADQLPDIPPKISIARRLIDWYVETVGSRR